MNRPMKTPAPSQNHPGKVAAGAGLPLRGVAPGTTRLLAAFFLLARLAKGHIASGADTPTSSRPLRSTWRTA